MIQIVCSVRDKATETFGRPFFVPAVGAAVRSFSDEVNRPAEDNLLYKHAQDYDLYRLGTFDDSIGLLISEERPVLLVAGSVVTGHSVSREVINQGSGIMTNF